MSELNCKVIDFLSLSSKTVKEERKKEKRLNQNNNVSKRNAKFLTHAATWMNYEDIMLNEIS